MRRDYYIIVLVLFLFSFGVPKMGGLKHNNKVNNVNDTLYVLMPIVNDSVKMKFDSLIRHKKVNDIIENVDIDEYAEKYIVHQEKTKASYYHDKFVGRYMAGGGKFDQNKLTAAYNVGSLKFGTKLRVTNLKNGKSVIVKLTDRGGAPLEKGKRIDLSREAISRLDSKYELKGVLDVKVEIVKV